MKRVLVAVVVMISACGPVTVEEDGGSGGGAATGGGSASTGGGAASTGGGDGSTGGGSASVGGGDGSTGGGTASVGGGDASTGGGAESTGGGTASTGGGVGSTGGGTGSTGGGAPAEPCITRITYGAAWLRPANHPADYDDVAGVVTWNGQCAQDASNNSYATFSNGWQPYFIGRSGCVLAFDQRGDCPTAAPTSCQTRISYGDTWFRAPSHPNDYDDVNETVTWDGVCRASGSDGQAVLSNGWAPTFNGAGNCEIALRYRQCGGLYENAVVPTDCPDPGVLKNGNTYYMACTGGGANKYPLRKSTNLVNWTSVGHVLNANEIPAWADRDFWAPELHKVGSKFVLYFSARHNNGIFAIGTATAMNPEGPYTAQATPLLQTGSPGVIDVHYFEAPNGTKYLLWKPDGNAIGQTTPIRIQPLSADGLSLTGSATTLLTNTLGWEGALIEAPWMIFEGGWYYLFYSANGYASNAYAIGVARSQSPTGPFTKKGDPILVTRGAWAGPGHGSIVKGPRGDWVHVYHSWRAGQVGSSGRLILVDRVGFSGGWPNMISAPSRGSQPLP